MPEVILPGTYITVRDEGLISAGRIASGYVGIVGTASAGPINQVQILGGFAEARQLFGESDAWKDGKQNELTLVRSLELIFNNGGQTVYAVRVAAQEARRASYKLLDKQGKQLAILEARDEGTWGNGITISVSEVTVPPAMAGGNPTTRQQLRLGYRATQELYTVGSVADLVAALNRSSALVTAKLESGVGSDATLGLTVNGEGKPGEATFSQGANGEAATAEDYAEGLEKLALETVNIVLLAGQDAGKADMRAALEGHLRSTAENQRERIGLMGAAAGTVDQIAEHPFNSDRLIYVAPGVTITVSDPQTRSATQVALPASYLAAAVAGLIASLPVQASPTNKTLAIQGLTSELTSGQLAKLVQSRVLVVERRQGYRVVKGITSSDNPAWHQITTRRIVDYALYGVRSACNPYIGKINNDRVRSAMRATLDGFLTRMVEDEALIGYSLDVTATRAQEIAGEAIVTLTIQPSFSIDFVRVTMYLS